jgi:hypothetical protein
VAGINTVISARILFGDIPHPSFSLKIDNPCHNPPQETKNVSWWFCCFWDEHLRPTIYADDCEATKLFWGAIGLARVLSVSLAVFLDGTRVATPRISAKLCAVFNMCYSWLTATTTWVPGQALGCKFCGLYASGLVIDGTSMKMDRSKFPTCLGWAYTHERIRTYAHMYLSHSHKYTSCHVRTHTHTQTYTHTLTQVHVPVAYGHPNMQTCTYTLTLLTHTQTCTHIHTHVHIHIHMYTYMIDTHIHTHLHAYAHAHTKAYTYIYTLSTHTYIQVVITSSLHVRMHACTHIDTHAHTHSMTGVRDGTPGHMRAFTSKTSWRLLQRELPLSHPLRQTGDGNPLNKREREAILKLCKNPDDFIDADMLLFQGPAAATQAAAQAGTNTGAQTPSGQQRTVPRLFARELVDTLQLLRSSSLQKSLRTSLCQLLRWSAENSSLQQTIPFTCLPDLQRITSSGLEWQAAYDEETQFRLCSFLGQPAVTDVLDALKTSKQEDVSKVLMFLDYLRRNVAFSLPSDVYDRVMLRVPQVWQRAFPANYTDNESGDSYRTVPSEDNTARDERFQSEAQHGIFYAVPEWTPLGWYPHIEKLCNSSTSEGDCDDCCNKKFGHAAGQTCELRTHTQTYIHAYTHTYTHIHTCMHTCTNRCIHTRARAHTYIHPFIHT